MKKRIPFLQHMTDSIENTYISSLPPEVRGKLFFRDIFVVPPVTRMAASQTDKSIFYSPEERLWFENEKSNLKNLSSHWGYSIELINDASEARDYYVSKRSATENSIESLKTTRVKHAELKTVDLITKEMAEREILRSAELKKMFDRSMLLAGLANPLDENETNSAINQDKNKQFRIIVSSPQMGKTTLIASIFLTCAYSYMEENEKNIDDYKETLHSIDMNPSDCLPVWIDDIPDSVSFYDSIRISLSKDNYNPDEVAEYIQSIQSSEQLCILIDNNRYTQVNDFEKVREWAYFCEELKGKKVIFIITITEKTDDNSWVEYNRRFATHKLLYRIDEMNLFYEENYTRLRNVTILKKWNHSFKRIGYAEVDVDYWGYRINLDDDYGIFLDKISDLWYIFLALIENRSMDASIYSIYSQKVNNAIIYNLAADSQNSGFIYDVRKQLALLSFYFKNFSDQAHNEDWLISKLRLIRTNNRFHEELSCDIAKISEFIDFIIKCGFVYNTDKNFVFQTVYASFFYALCVQNNYFHKEKKIDYFETLDIYPVGLDQREVQLLIIKDREIREVLLNRVILFHGKDARPWALHHTTRYFIIGLLLSDIIEIDTEKKNELIYILFSNGGLNLQDAKEICLLLRKGDKQLFSEVLACIEKQVNRGIEKKHKCSILFILLYALVRSPSEDNSAFSILRNIVDETSFSRLFFEALAEIVEQEDFEEKIIKIIQIYEKKGNEIETTRLCDYYRTLLFLYLLRHSSVKSECIIPDYCLRYGECKTESEIIKALSEVLYFALNSDNMKKAYRQQYSVLKEKLPNIAEAIIRDIPNSRYLPIRELLLSSLVLIYDSGMAILSFWKSFDNDFLNWMFMQVGLNNVYDLNSIFDWKSEKFNIYLQVASCFSVGMQRNIHNIPKHVIKDIEAVFLWSPNYKTVCQAYKLLSILNDFSNINSISNYHFIESRFELNNKLPFSVCVELKQCFIEVDSKYWDNQILMKLHQNHIVKYASFILDHKKYVLFEFHRDAELRIRIYRIDGKIVTNVHNGEEIDHLLLHYSLTFINNTYSVIDIHNKIFENKTYNYLLSYISPSQKETIDYILSFYLQFN